MNFADKASGHPFDARSLEQARSLRFGETLSLHYRLRMRNGAKIEHLVRDLSILEGVERVSLLIDGMQDDDEFVVAAAVQQTVAPPPLPSAARSRLPSS